MRDNPVYKTISAQNFCKNVCIAASAFIFLMGCNGDQTTAQSVETSFLEDMTQTKSELNVDEPTDEGNKPERITESESLETLQDTSQPVSASEPSELRHADSHVHGAATLALALDSTVLSIEFESPLYNFVGFEHAPGTEAEIAALETAETKLSQPNDFFQFNPEAACVARPIDRVDLTPPKEAAQNDTNDHDDSQKQEHAHAHHHDGSDNHEHGHKDALLSFSFDCQYPKSIKWVNTALFETFEYLTEIDLVYLGPAQQISSKLTSDSTRISLVD